MMRCQLCGSFIIGLSLFGAIFAWNVDAGAGKLEKSD